MHDPSENTVVLDYVTLYDYGLDGWLRIFNRIPELIHDPSDKRRKAEVGEEAGLEEQGYTMSEDSAHWSGYYSYYLYLSAMGTIW
jgi:hypothetical protein